MAHLLLVALLANPLAVFRAWNRGTPDSVFQMAWVATRDPSLANWLLYLHWSRSIARSQRDLARRDLQQALQQAETNAEAARTLTEPLQDFFRAFRHAWPPETLLAWLDTLESRWPGLSSVWLLYERGWQTLRQENPARAGTLWARVVQEAPASPYARWLLANLDSLLPLSARERGYALYRQGRYREALPLLRSSTEHPFAYLVCLYRLRENREFLRAYRRLRRRLKPAQRHRLDYYRAVVLDRMGRKQEAIRTLVHLARQSSRWRDAAVTYASLLGLETNYITRTARLLERRLGAYPAARSRAALLHLVMNRRSQAQRLFRRNLRASGFYRAQALYFLYRLTHNRAYADTLRAEFPLSYYTARLSEPPEALHRHRGCPGPDACPPSHRFRVLTRTLFNGWAERDPFARSCPLKAALLADSSGNPALVIRMAQRVPGLQDRPDSLALALLFPLPAPWRRALQSLHLADPWLLLGLVREESHFRPFVVSPAGAIGLSQVMPTTYRQLFPDGQDGDLFAPLQNLRAGAAVLQRELDTFGSPMLALAAYNAGPHRVRTWQNLWRRRGILNHEDLWVEFIPYRETRNYVRRVYRSWRMYRWLYPAAF